MRTSTGVPSSCAKDRSDGRRCHEHEILLAEKISEVVPSIERVFLTSSEVRRPSTALRLARAATGRRGVISSKAATTAGMTPLP